MCWYVVISNTVTFDRKALLETFGKLVYVVAMNKGSSHLPGDKCARHTLGRGAGREQLEQRIPRALLLRVG